MRFWFAIYKVMLLQDMPQPTGSCLPNSVTQTHLHLNNNNNKKNSPTYSRVLFLKSKGKVTKKKREKKKNERFKKVSLLCPSEENATSKD